MVEKLQKSVEAGNFYEAQQMYKSVHARYMAQKKYADAIDLVQSGACVQLRHKQATCGSELGIILVETFNTSDTQLNPESLGRLEAVYKSFPREEVGGDRYGASSSDADGKVSDASSLSLEEVRASAKMRVDACTAFLKAAIRWSARHGGPPSGAPELHDMLAEYTWSQLPTKDLASTSKHFVHGSRPEVFAGALIDVMRECFPGEIDLVLTLGVLQYLALGNLRDANRLIDEVRRRSMSFSAPPIPDTPLMHFVKFLLLTLERDAVPLFRMLRNRYRPSIERDPTFNEYLDEVATRFYGLPKPGGMQGMLGDIMKMLSGDD